MDFRYIFYFTQAGMNLKNPDFEIKVRGIIIVSSDKLHDFLNNLPS